MNDNLTANNNTGNINKQSESVNPQQPDISINNNLQTNSKPQMVENSQSIVTTPSNERNNKKIASLFIIIFITVILAAGGFYLYVKSTQTKIPENQNLQGLFQPVKNASPIITPTPTITDIYQNWKTYQNTNVGYSFLYPQAFLLDVDNDEGVLLEYLTETQTANGMEMSSNIKIIIQETELGNIGLTDYVEDERDKESVLVENSVVSEVLEDKIGEFTGFGYSIDGVTDRKRVYFSINNYVVKISLDITKSNQDFEKNNGLVEDILKSFASINKNTSNELGPIESTSSSEITN